MTPTDTTQIRNMVQEAKEATTPKIHVPQWAIYTPTPDEVHIANLARAVESLCNLIDQKDDKFRPQGAP